MNHLINEVKSTLARYRDKADEPHDGIDSLAEWAADAFVTVYQFSWEAAPQLLAQFDEAILRQTAATANDRETLLEWFEDRLSLARPLAKRPSPATRPLPFAAGAVESSTAGAAS